MEIDEYLVAVGTVTGYSHRQLGKNNQDGYAVAVDEKHIAAVVCDGCSSSRDSEVGAKLIAKFSAQKILRIIQEKREFYIPNILPLLQESIIGLLKDISKKYIDPLEAVDDMFLSTIMGAVVNDFMVMVFSLGDGVFSINKETKIIDEKNTPTYLGYKIFPGSYCVEEEKVNFVVRSEFGLTDLESLVIGTDGAVEIQEKADQKLWVLGNEEQVKDVSQFEIEEKYLKNPLNVQRRLFQLNMEKTIIDWEKQEIKKFRGMLSDDTTIILIRRR